jgi:glycosyltransferase involved in cell wall biosynthesis
LADRLLIDVSGLVHWHAYFDNPSGIQRFTQKIVASRPVAGDDRAECVARALGSTKFYRVPKETIAGLGDPARHASSLASLRALFAASMAIAPLRDLARETRWIHWGYIARGRLLSRPVEIVEPPDGGDVLVNLGDFWSQPRLVDALVELKAATGVAVVHMLHDLIPFEHPEWTYPFYTEIFVRQFARLAPLVDRWIVTSDYVRVCLEKYLAGRAIEPRPTDVVAPGWDEVGAGRSARPAHHVQPGDRDILARFGLQGARYVLQVGTVEARKNQLALIEAMARLRRRHGGDPAHLVLVGRPGWEAGLVRDRLRASGNEGGTVTWLKDATDAELPALYRGAMFSVVPSHVEGWGLPVRESLGHGTPCLASRSGALPEAGGALAAYYDPDRPEALEEALACWLLDGGALADSRAALARRMDLGNPFPTWEEAGAAILALADRGRVGRTTSPHGSGIACGR